MGENGGRAMKLLVIVVGVIVATSALAQEMVTPPKEPLMPGEAESLVKESCEYLETINGIKIWGGDCVSASPSAEAVRPKKNARQRKAKKRKPLLL